MGALEAGAFRQKNSERVFSRFFGIFGDNLLSAAGKGTGSFFYARVLKNSEDNTAGGGYGMLVEKTQIMDQKAMSRAITRISFEIIEHNKGAGNLCIIGIVSRGAQLAQRIAKKISELEGTVVEVGYLDVTPYRDDKKLDASLVDRTDLPFSIEGKQIILVDDVIYTGRTVRAAMDAILQRGRAKSIQLAALIDRGHRELPIRADYVGKNLPTSRDEFVRVSVQERDGEDQVAICIEMPDPNDHQQ